MTKRVCTHKAGNMHTLSFIGIIKQRAHMVPLYKSQSLAVSQFGCCILRRPHLWADNVTFVTTRPCQFQDSFKCSQRMQASLLEPQVCTRWILHGSAYLKMHCSPAFYSRGGSNSGCHPQPMRCKTSMLITTLRTSFPVPRQIWPLQNA